MRSSDATVCRLFFTRWWISRIVASLVISSRSWWRTSVTSRHSTIAPTRSPRLRIGMVRRLTVTPRASMSVRHGARPVTTSGSDSSTSFWPTMRSVVTSASDSASSSPAKPMRLKAESAFGLAKVTMPSTSNRMRPSDARGAARRGAEGAPGSGKSPCAIIANRSLAHSLKVSSWRLGVRASLRLVCRVITATGNSVVWLPLGFRRRITGTARTRVGVSSYQSGVAVSTMAAVSKASVTWRVHSGLIT